ncbi:MAG: PIN domain-containing protein [Actinomycetota bacterium]|nr:PIN domain-containing protein [Actinomycetota bacterium]
MCGLAALGGAAPRRPKPCRGRGLLPDRQAPGSESGGDLLRSLTGRRYRTESPTDSDLQRAADLVEQYVDLRLGGTDALIIATAERLGLQVLATLDQRHFSVVRPAHVAALTPEPRAGGGAHRRCSRRQGRARTHGLGRAGRN